MQYTSALINFVTVLSLICLSNALECYVCDNQEDNLGKCIRTIATCKYGEDVCLSEISWGSLPYFQQGAVKQYYISKRCATEDKCAKYRSTNMAYCSHIWYQDWKCSECCKGDRCNYFIISGSSRNHINHLSILSTALLMVLYTFFLK